MTISSDQVRDIAVWFFPQYEPEILKCFDSSGKDYDNYRTALLNELWRLEVPRSEITRFDSAVDFGVADEGVFHAPGKIENYTLVERIDEGGMGIVYKYADPLGRFVAIKFHTQQPQWKRVKREVRIGEIDSEYVVKVYSCGWAGLPFIVMEYFEGKNLRDLLHNEGLSVKEAFLCLGHAARGLVAAHDKGVIHRDIKPSNLLYERRNGRPLVKICDFGISKFVQLTDQETLTKHDEFLGTMHYMSPEQHRSPSNATPASDVYSLGWTFYEILTRQPPPQSHWVHGSTAARQCYCTLLKRPDIHRAMAVLFVRMVQQEIDRRPDLPSIIDTLDAVAAGNLTDKQMNEFDYEQVASLDLVAATKNDNSEIATDPAISISNSQAIVIQRTWHSLAAILGILTIVAVAFLAFTGSWRQKSSIPTDKPTAEHSEDNETPDEHAPKGFILPDNIDRFSPVLKNFVDSIVEVDCSPDGRMTACGLKSGEICLVDIGKNQVTERLDHHLGNEIRSLVFSPDGKQLVSGDREGRVFVWNLVEKTLHHITDGFGTARDLSWSHDARFLAMAHGHFNQRTQQISVWQQDEKTTTWNSIRVWKPKPQERQYFAPAAVSFSPSDDRLLIASLFLPADHIGAFDADSLKTRVEIWEFDQFGKFQSPQLAPMLSGRGVQSIEWRKDVVLIATDSHIDFIGLDDFSVRASLAVNVATARKPGKGERIIDMADLDENSQIVVLGNGQVQRWHQGQFTDLRFRGENVICVDGHPDSGFVTGGTCLGVWSNESRTANKLIGTGAVTDIIALDGEKVGIGCRDGSVFEVSVRDGHAVNLGNHSSAVDSVARIRNKLVTTTTDGAIKVWPRAVGKPLDITAKRTAILATNDAHNLIAASGDDEKRIRVFDGQGKETTINHDLLIGSLAFLSPDLVAFGEIRGELWAKLAVVDLKTQTEKIQNTKLRDHILVLAVSPDGKYLAGGAAHGTISIWPLEDTGLSVDKERPVVAHGTDQTEQIVDLGFDPQGIYLASTCADKTLNVTAVDECKCGDPVSLNAFPEAMSWSPDGHLLAVAQSDGVVTLWKYADSRLASAGELKGQNSGRVTDVLWQGDRIVTAGSEGTLRAHNAATLSTEWITIFLSGGNPVTLQPSRKLDATDVESLTQQFDLQKTLP